MTNPALNMNFFPFWFAMVWICATSFMGLVSGWYRLAEKYPDLPGEEPLLKLSQQNGAMGGISFKGVLRLSACPSGLRVGMMRFFGPFSKNFLVPWEQISSKTEKRFLQGQMTEMRFGIPALGRLVVRERVANSLLKLAPKL